MSSFVPKIDLPTPKLNSMCASVWIFSPFHRKLENFFFSFCIWFFLSIFTFWSIPILSKTNQKMYYNERIIWFSCIHTNAGSWTNLFWISLILWFDPLSVITHNTHTDRHEYFAGNNWTYRWNKCAACVPSRYKVLYSIYEYNKQKCVCAKSEENHVSHIFQNTPFYGFGLVVEKKWLWFFTHFHWNKRKNGMNISANPMKNHIKSTQQKVCVNSVIMTSAFTTAANQNWSLFFSIYAKNLADYMYIQ